MNNEITRLMLWGMLASTVMACSGSGNSDVSTGMQSDEIDPVNNNPSNVSMALEEGLIGPLGGSGIDGEYSQYNDSPFANLSFGNGYFYLEDFEDNVFEHPGARASDGGFVTSEFGVGFHDSVDADDGLIDGTSLDGESWFYAVSTIGVVWSFDRDALGGQLPTHAGIVWTDGNNETRFEAFDASGVSLGTIVASHDNASFNGETIDDRFYGVVHYGGISAIKISNNDRRNGIELDHLQWGYLPVELR